MSEADKYGPPKTLAEVAGYHENKMRLKAGDAEHSAKLKNVASAREARRNELWHQAAANLLQQEALQ